MSGIIDLAKIVIESMEEDCAFDQPCEYGWRVGGHSVYCENNKWKGAPRKCRRSWFTGGEVKDEDCEGFKKNQDYKEKEK